MMVNEALFKDITLTVSLEHSGGNVGVQHVRVW